MANGENAKAVHGLLDVERGRDVTGNQIVDPGIERILSAEGDMQEREMLRIDVAFVTLQIVAGVIDLGAPGLFSGAGHERERRDPRWPPRAHVGQDQSAGLVARIGRMANLVLVITCRRFTRLLEAAAIA